MACVDNDMICTHDFDMGLMCQTSCLLDFSAHYFWREEIVLFECTSQLSNINTWTPRSMLLILLKWLQVDESGAFKTNSSVKLTYKVF